MIKIKKSIVFVLILVVLIQFYPMDKPKVSLDKSNDFLIHSKVPSEVAHIIKTSCYDCHSNESKFPWYSKIAPVKWLLYHDINEGREELNFSEWNSLSEDDKYDKLFDIQDEVNEGEMPMKIYTFIHKEARLTSKQKTMISDFVESMIK